MSDVKPSAILLIGALLMAGPAAALSPSVTSQTREFLDAYERGDRAAVLRVLDPEVTIYGSDISEYAHGRAAAEQILEADQRLWHGAASIGKMDHLSMASGGDLTVLTFDAPFELGGRPPVTVRFSMTWRRLAGGWRLVQSANSVPTVGQSAADLLKAAAP